MLKIRLKKIINPYILNISKKFSSKPDKKRIFFSLDALRQNIYQSKRGLVLDLENHSKFIIFSDQHRGGKDLADDFRLSEPNYIAALNWYYEGGYTLISLGDSEELWENTIFQIKKHNKASFELEGKFHSDNRLQKVFGNHDLFWDNDPLAAYHLKDIYGSAVPIHEGILINGTKKTNQPFQIFLTHGHQGDKNADGNWFSKWFVSMIWAPLQAFLEINPNTPAYNTEHKTLHNQLMYEWVAQHNDLILITGHTHQPVFQSLTYLERLYLQLELAREKQDFHLQQQIEKKLVTQLKKGETIPTYKAFKPNYFNSGCCCYSDGDITGIEISKDTIQLVKWRKDPETNLAGRTILEKAEIDNCVPC